MKNTSVGALTSALVSDAVFIDLVGIEPSWIRGMIDLCESFFQRGSECVCQVRIPRGASARFLVMVQARLAEGIQINHAAFRRADFVHQHVPDKLRTDQQLRSNSWCTGFRSVHTVTQQQRWLAVVKVGFRILETVERVTE